ncbi:MAG: cob(I)yrinic acid a,c-diamide adenosyltransferase [Desulfatitalea sp.]|nr:cob(I)yrinic acid a,c-diamide adenosyltransferase [Desulfatitalea sp.]NNJ98959.1 cob(I)yrinic acid a,c-diamide adenosyltransferase [Desulfatitalea sp.]
MKKGLLIINTGNGKGKTTAALGMAMRAAGHGMRICIIQFIKGDWPYGELTSIKKLADTIEIHVMGRGCTWLSDDIEKDKAAALDAWDFAQNILADESYDLVVLDEFTFLLKYDIVAIQPVLAVLARRPPTQHVVITGRSAPEALVAAADLVTEMVPIKHPYDIGIKAQQGVEF